jgi:hypothetical protein
LTASGVNAEEWARFEHRRKLLATVEYMDDPLPERSLWPIRPWPMPDELLSSWLNRVAIANGLAPRSLHLSLARAAGWKTTLTRFVRVNGTYRVMTKETCWVDLRCGARVVDYLVRLSGMPASLIQSLALRRPKGVSKGTLTRAGTLQWELIEARPGMILPDDDQCDFMRFCPYCLAEWDDPWVPKFWRTTLAAVCTRHGCRMLSNCICGKAVRPHLSRTVQSQAFCYACNRDLRERDAAAAFPHEMRTERESRRRAYEQVENIIRSGGGHEDIVDLMATPIRESILDLKPRKLLLRRTGMIDIHARMFALALLLIYRNIRRGKNL